MSNLHQKLIHQKIKRFEPRAVDVTMDILQLLLQLQPHSSFIQSLHQQYCERGGLSRKQLEGLHNKAAKCKEVPAQKLATLEAIIKLKPVRNKSSLPTSKKEPEADVMTNKMMEELLVKFPLHKRLLFLQSIFNKNKMLLAAEKEEVHKFYKLLIK
jgi:hypothetical protein